MFPIGGIPFRVEISSLVPEGTVYLMPDYPPDFDFDLVTFRFADDAIRYGLVARARNQEDWMKAVGRIRGVGA